MWHLSDRADKRALPLADRHYNRQKIGSPQYVPPGRCLALLTVGATALWVTSWPFAQYVRHAWPGAWMNSLFRNERRDLHQSSDLIREAVAVTRWFYGVPPGRGMVTFVDPGKVKRKRDPGRCYLRAGFSPAGHFKVGSDCEKCHANPKKPWPCGRTKGDLLAFQLLPDDMPEPAEPIGAERSLFEEAINA